VDGEREAMGAPVVSELGPLRGVQQRERRGPFRGCLLAVDHYNLDLLLLPPATCPQAARWEERAMLARRARVPGGRRRNFPAAKPSGR
jgi:hypothetical protein